MNIAETKIAFCEYIDRDISIIDLEKSIYEIAELENTIDNEIYYELINFDFKQDAAYKMLDAFILNNIINETEYNSWKINKLLKEAGWFKGRKTKVPIDNSLKRWIKKNGVQNIPAYKNALKIVEEYGAIKIDYKNQEQICFNDSLKNFTKFNDVGMLIGIANAKDTYVSVFVGPQDKYYLHMDISENWYFGGNNFEQMITKIVLGDNDYGPLLSTS